VLLQTPNGATVLVDGGRYPTRLLTALGDRLPFYDNTIELLVLTQPDDFDTSALVEVLGRYEVGAVVTNGQPNVSAVQARLQTLLSDIPMMVATQGTTIELSDGVNIEVVNPLTTPTIDSSMGEGALVLRVTYGERSFLLTSDLSRDQQEQLLRQVDLTSDIVQLPDHATARSLNSDFVEAVQPSMAVVAIDPANGRGDPSPDILGLLGETPILRTDLAGTIHFYTDGQKVWVVPENS
jgi:competence protein ComEC